MPNLSVIVCFYNAEKYIKKCLKSLIEQSYKSFELILVDDGSIDASVKECESYLHDFYNAKIVHKKHGGLVSARKIGVKSASGEYICCIDADDWVEVDYIEQLQLIANKTEADLIISKHFYDFDDLRKIVSSGFKSGKYSNKDLMPKMLYDGTFYKPAIQPFFHGKVFKRSILQSVQVEVNENITMGEDVAVIYPVLSQSNVIFLSDYCGYHYVQHNESMVRTTSSNEYEKLIMLKEHLLSFFQEKCLWQNVYWQINQFVKCSLLTRCIGKCDEYVKDSHTGILYPYGGIRLGSKIILYGAGILGHRIYDYVTMDSKLHIVKWVDRSYQVYLNENKHIECPDKLKEISEGEYDFIIVAVTIEAVANEIRKELIDYYDVKSEKIRWLTDSFINKDIYV